MSGYRENDDGLLPDPGLLKPPARSEHEVLTVRQVNEQISGAIARAFPGTVWVRGEVQRLPQDAARRTHIYFELHETGSSGAAEYQLSVSLMGWDRQRFGLGRYLDGSDPDFQFANKIEVCLECKVDFYAKFGKLSLKVVGVDTNFALGRLEARRRETLAYLEAHGLLSLNRAVKLPELPLHVGLITSPGSAAEQDFRTGLAASPWAFIVNLTGARMQGAQLQDEVIAALGRQVTAGVDVVVITRGGGSRADLSWFDQQPLAEAIARCPLPVVTAIGHEIDRSIADLVAHHSCKTPTAAAEFLVATIGEAAARVAEAEARLVAAAAAALDEARERLAIGGQLPQAARGAVLRARLRFQAAAGRLQQVVGGSLAVRQRRLTDLRVRLGSAATTALSRHEVRLGRLSAGLAGTAAARLQTDRARLDQQQERLAREALRPLAPWSRRLAGYETQARLLDPARLLQRGYTITLGPDGRSLDRAAKVGPGDILKTVFVDGEVRSIVQPGGGAGKSKQGKARKDGGKKGKAHAGQKTLFR